MEFFDQFDEQQKDEIIPSPLNYTGSKFKLVKTLKSHFPSESGSFYDLFTGGGSVFVNCQSFDKIYANDKIKPLMDFYKYLQQTPWESVLKNIETRNIPKDDQEAYLGLRKRFNEDRDFIDFFILVCSCTNNMMRFNKSLGFNQTFGKRNFNSRTAIKLKSYHDVIYNNEKIVFTNNDFSDVIPEKGSFVYLDPPYMITEAGYNAYWSKELECKFYDYIDMLDESGVKFMISNVSEHKGKVNPYLSRVQKYNIIDLDFNYNKVSRSGESNSKEIIVINY